MPIAFRSLSLMFIVILLGCDSSTDPEPVQTGPNGVFILNEGAFLAGNAELSFYDPAMEIVSGNLYASANNGSTLGDVANSMAIHGDRLFIVMNNSSRIEVVDVRDHTSVGRILLPGLPRQMAIVDAGKAYVTMQDSTVAIVDLQQFAVTRSITTGPFPDGITRARGKLFVMNGGFGSGSTISVIDEATDSVIVDIPTPFGPTYATTGSDERVYVVCTGFTDYTQQAGDTPGAILIIDPSAMRIVDSLSVLGHPGKMALDSLGFMFLLGPGQYPSTPVWKLQVIPSLQVLTQTLVEGSFYGIGIHMERQEIYLADAGSFVTNGRVQIHGYDGMYKKTLVEGIGIAPNAFLVTGD